MQLSVFQVDAFADAVFRGNPAAVVPLDEWLPERTMQAIAQENNLSDTAFFVPADGGYQLRWFTPAVEVALCGHATLATAHVICDELSPGTERVVFDSASGELVVTRDGGLLALDFPLLAPEPCEMPRALPAALGAMPREVLGARDYLAVFDSEEQVRALAPDFRKLAREVDRCVIATAPSAEVDFVSRFFAPSHGIDEDPVTGSAHCTLAPYWSARLGKAHLDARQVSARGGALVCALRDQRVHIAGNAVLYMKGTIYI